MANLTHRIDIFSDGFIDVDAPVCKEALPIGVQRITLQNKTDKLQPIMDTPDSIGEQIGVVRPGESVVCLDYYIPDRDGFGVENKKWVPLKDRSGYIIRENFTGWPERRAVGEHYLDAQRHIQFDDGTCKAVPEVETWETYRVPDVGMYARVVHDLENPSWDFKPRTRSEAPETVPMWDKPDFYELSDAWIDLWFRLINWANHGCLTGGQKRTVWADVTADRKALTDNNSIHQDHRDPILRVNMDMPFNLRHKGLVFGGTMVKRKFGSTIFALDPAKDPPTLKELLPQRHLWGWLTVINRDAVSSKWSQQKPWGGWGVPYLIFGYDGQNTLRDHHLIRLDNGASYSPYANR